MDWKRGGVGSFAVTGGMVKLYDSVCWPARELRSRGTGGMSTWLGSCGAVPFEPLMLRTGGVNGRGLNWLGGCFGGKTPS